MCNAHWASTRIFALKFDFHAKIMQFKGETFEFLRKKSSILGSKIQIFQDFDFCLKCDKK